MRAELLSSLGFRCPRCRHVAGGRVVSHELALAESALEERGCVLEGLLECASPECRARYPILRGVPIVLADLVGWWRSAAPRFAPAPAASCGLRALLADLERECAAGAPGTDALEAHELAHFGEVDAGARVPPGVPAPERFWARLRGLAALDTPPRSARALDVGCSVGRFTFELAACADLAIGLDLSFAAVERAAQRARRADAPNVAFLVADALDPPFAADSFDFVAALDLLDSVRLPLVLLGQLDALLAPGGRLLLSSPYAWRADVTAPEEWLVSPAASSMELLRDILAGRALSHLGLRYALEAEDRALPRALRERERKWNLFVTDAICARKQPAPAGVPHAGA
jgi:SAM-dependent methyltransferase/uncharacterized protein YbaR (Trm112 family)